MLALIEAILSKLSSKKKKRPATQRVEEPMTLNEFDINAAVAKLKANKVLNQRSYDQQKNN